MSFEARQGQSGPEATNVVLVGASSIGHPRHSPAPRAAGSPPSTKEAAIAVKEEKLEMEGEITESLRNRMFRITLDNGHEMIGYTAGKMRRYRIRMDRAIGSRSRCPPTTSTADGSSTGCDNAMGDRVEEPTSSCGFARAARAHADRRRSRHPRPPRGGVRVAAGAQAGPARAEHRRLPRSVRPDGAGGAHVPHARRRDAGGAAQRVPSRPGRRSLVSPAPCRGPRSWERSSRRSH